MNVYYLSEYELDVPIWEAVENACAGDAEMMEALEPIDAAELAELLEDYQQVTRQYRGLCAPYEAKLAALKQDYDATVGRLETRVKALCRGRVE